LSHKYIHPLDRTGNAEYISVTTIIERFFPFDLNLYIEKKAERECRTEEEILDEYLVTRDEAALKGTELHKLIENYLKFSEKNDVMIEFSMFLDFYEKEIKTRGLSFYEAEKKIFSNRYNIAGTVDCLFKKNGKDEWVVLDWKRSKKIIIDGSPRIFGSGYALSELCSLDNSSYNRYCLQQNLYKRILEDEYSLKISSMKLVVLHENYAKYHIIDVPSMDNYVERVLYSLKVKI
jgi:ATP-dependent exoDNAse (exonuclease V) beta subunit